MSRAVSCPDELSFFLRAESTICRSQPEAQLARVDVEGVVGVAPELGGGVASPSISSNERIAPTLCAYGLIADLVAAGAGYAICVYIRGNFFFGATEPGKTVWIGARGLCTAVYVVGIFYGVAGVRRAAAQRR